MPKPPKSQKPPKKPKMSPVARFPVLHKDPVMQLRQVVDGLGKIRFALLLTVDENGQPDSFAALGAAADDIDMVTLIGQMEASKQLLLTNLLAPELLEILDDAADEEHSPEPNPDDKNKKTDGA